MDEKLKERLLKTFRIEANEHLQNIGNGLLQFEQLAEDAEKKQLLEDIYRDAHSLKGASRAVNLMDIVELCQNVENIFSALKQNKMDETSELFDSVQKSLSVIDLYINEDDDNKKVLLLDEIDQCSEIIDEYYSANIKTENEGDKTGGKPEINKVEKIKPDEKPVTPKKVQSESKSKISPQNKIKNIDTIRITVDKLEKLLINSEELIPVKLINNEVVNDINGLTLLLENLKRKWNKNRNLFNDFKEFVSSDKSVSQNESDFSELISFFESNESMIDDFYNLLSEINLRMAKNTQKLANISYELDLDIRASLMLPFSILTDQFPLMVREIAADLGKTVELKISGSNIEIDKRILEELKDPLVHLLRNSIDHGIESVETREKNGKPAKGTIALELNQTVGDKVELVISDDGQGIDPDVIGDIAVKKGIVSQAELAGMEKIKFLILFLNQIFQLLRLSPIYPVGVWEWQ